MGVISAINAMNASMNATRLSSVNLASALETYAAVIASPPPPPYSSAPPSIAEASQNEARGMCFTHAAVFWMEWATIQANLQLSLMQDLFKLKSLANLADERKRGVDIDIEPHKFDVLEADSIHNMVVKLTKLSHESFQEGYKKGTDWNGVGGLDYWITQVEHYNSTVPCAPNMATSKVSSNLGTPPHSFKSAVELETVMKTIRAEHDSVSLRRKRNNEDLRGSNKTSDHDSDSNHSKQSGSDNKLHQSGLSDISGAFHCNAQRTAKVTTELPDSESDYDNAQILCRHPREEEKDGTDSNPHPTSPKFHKHSGSDLTGNVGIGFANSPPDLSGLTSTCLAEVVAHAHLPGDCNAESQGMNHHDGEIDSDGAEVGAMIVMYDSGEEEGGSFKNSPSFSDRSVGSSYDTDCDHIFYNTVDYPDLQVSGEGSYAHKQASALKDKEVGLCDSYLVGDTMENPWQGCARSVKPEVTHADGSHPPDSSYTEIYTFQDLLYAITEESTIKSTSPRIGRISALSIFPTTHAKGSKNTEETKCVPPGIRRKGKFQKKNGCLQMLAAGEGGWRGSGFSEEEEEEEEYLIHKEPMNGGWGGHQLHGGVKCQGNYPHRQLEIPIDVGNIVDLPRHSKLGYFTEDFQQLPDNQRTNSACPRWVGLSYESEGLQPTPAGQMAGQAEETSTFFGRIRYNCFKGSKADSE